MVPRRLRRTSGVGAGSRRMVRRRLVVARPAWPSLRLGAARLGRAVRAVVESLQRPLFRPLQPAVCRQRRRAPGRAADALCQLAGTRRNHRGSGFGAQKRRPRGDQPRAGPRGSVTRVDAARAAATVHAGRAGSARYPRCRTAPSTRIDARGVQENGRNATERSQYARARRSGRSGRSRHACTHGAAGCFSRWCRRRCAAFASGRGGGAIRRAGHRQRAARAVADRRRPLCVAARVAVRAAGGRRTNRRARGARNSAAANGSDHGTARDGATGGTCKRAARAAARCCTEVAADAGALGSACTEVAAHARAAGSGRTKVAADTRAAGRVIGAAGRGSGARCATRRAGAVAAWYAGPRCADQSRSERPAELGPVLGPIPGLWRAQSATSASRRPSSSVFTRSPSRNSGLLSYV